MNTYLIGKHTLTIVKQRVRLSENFMLQWSGKEITRFEGTSFGASHTFWLSIDEPDTRRLLIKLRIDMSSVVRDLSVWVDPSDAQLESLGEGRLVGCAALTDTKTSNSALTFLKDLKDDLAAFVGSGLRHSLTNLLVVVFVYGALMTLTKMLHDNPTTKRMTYAAIVWFICIGVGAGAGTGYAIRHPGAGPQLHRWKLVSGVTVGILAGTLLGAFHG